MGASIISTSIVCKICQNMAMSKKLSSLDFNWLPAGGEDGWNGKLIETISIK
jgi:hypothetical protein